MRVLLTGGGTGGHLYPGLAIVDALRRRSDCTVCFVGTSKGLEARIIPQVGFAFFKVWISGLKRGKIWVNFLFPLKMLVSLVQSIVIIARFEPDVIIGTGGYVSWPVLTAGILMCKRTVIQEQNQVPGLVTKLLAPFVKSVHLSFESSQAFFWKRSNLYVSGNPTRWDLGTVSRKDGYRKFGLKPDKLTLFVFGGSQGAWSINHAVLGMLDDLLERKDVQLIWVVGPRWLEIFDDQLTPYEKKVKVFAFIHEMKFVYKICDLVICRAGATTVAELTRYGIPAVFVPFPGAVGAHQEKNARYLSEKGAAEVVLEDEIKKGRLRKVVFSLLDDKERRRKMGEKIKEFGKPDAANDIAQDIIRLVSGEKSERI